MDDTNRCQGCGARQFRFIQEWDLLLCHCCIIALDYVTTPEREYILGQINLGNSHPGCCWLYDQSGGTCRIHGNQFMKELA